MYLCCHLGHADVLIFSDSKNKTQEDSLGHFRVKNSCNIISNLITYDAIGQVEFGDYYKIIDFNEQYIKVNFTNNPLYSYGWILKSCGDFFIKDKRRLVADIFSNENAYALRALINDFDNDVNIICGDWGEIATKEKFISTLLLEHNSDLLYFLGKMLHSFYSDILFDDYSVANEVADLFFKHGIFNKIFCVYPYDGIDFKLPIYWFRYFEMQKEGWLGLGKDNKQKKQKKSNVHFFELEYIGANNGVRNYDSAHYIVMSARDVLIYSLLAHYRYITSKSINDYCYLSIDSNWYIFYFENNMLSDFDAIESPLCHGNHSIKKCICGLGG